MMMQWSAQVAAGNLRLDDQSGAMNKAKGGTVFSLYKNSMNTRGTTINTLDSNYWEMALIPAIKDELWYFIRNAIRDDGEDAW